MSAKPPAQNDSNSAIMTELLEKMIDSQTENTRALTTLTEQIASGFENRTCAGPVTKVLSEINAHFTNGFRSEIKAHINQAIEAHQNKAETIVTANGQRIDELSKKVDAMTTVIDKHYAVITRPGFWLKGFVAFVIAIAAIISGVTATVNSINADQKQKVQNAITLIEKLYKEHHPDDPNLITGKGQ